jgi:hypothetical protein
MAAAEDWRSICRVSGAHKRLSCQTPPANSLAIQHRRRDIRAMKRVLRDIQFWIPVVVLIGGLMVLQWIR